LFLFSSRRRHTIFSRDWSSDVCSSDLTACEAALGETLGWLEREACFVRRGTNKVENRDAWGAAWGTRRMVARGFVGAAYRHRTSDRKSVVEGKGCGCRGSTA